MFFIIYQLEDYWSIMKLSCRLLTLNSYKAFLKNKNRSDKTLSAPFSTKLLKTKKFCYILLPDFWPYLTVCLPLIHAILGNIQFSKGRPLESLVISVIPGFQVVYPCIIRWPNLFPFRSLFSFCIDFLHHWWLLKVKTEQIGLPK